MGGEDRRASEKGCDRRERVRARRATEKSGGQP